MKRCLLAAMLPLLLTACEQPVAFRPVTVDMPVAQSCPLPAIPKPPDTLATLPAATPLDDALRTCLQQTLVDQAYETKLAAVQNACRQ